MACVGPQRHRKKKLVLLVAFVSNYKCIQKIVEKKLETAGRLSVNSREF